MIKKNYVFVICFLVFSLWLPTAMAQDALVLQKNLEAKLQDAIDRLMGKDRVLVFIELAASDVGWKVEFDEKAIAGGEDRFNRNIVPGIPSLKFMQDTGEGGVHNYTVTEVNAKIAKIDLTLVVDSTLKVNEIRRVKDFSAQYLNLVETRGDTVRILKEPFAKITADGKKITGEAAAAEAARAKKGKNFLVLSLSASAIFVVLALAAMIIFFLLRKKKQIKAGAPSEEQKDAAGKTVSTEALAEDAAKVELTDEERQRLNERKILGNGARYFTFITDENVFKLKFLLQLKIALNQATPKTVAAVLSCLQFKLAASILVEYPLKIQAEIVTHLLEMQYVPEDQIKKLEQDIQLNIDHIFGGKYKLQQLLAKLDGYTKKKIVEMFKTQFPTKAADFQSLVILFEDLLQHDEEVLQRVFGELDSQVVATALVHVDKQLQDKVLESLSKGVKAMVVQWLEAKSRSATKLEIESARQQINKFAQYLAQEGFIKI